MNIFVSPLPGLLDDPQFQILDLPTRRIAPLRDPVPSRALSIPSPLEPNAPHVSDARASKAKLNGHTSTATTSTALKVTPKITPADVILARDGEKKSNISLAISELVEDTARHDTSPLFVSLSAVEKFSDPSHAFNSDESRKRLRLDLEDIIMEEYIHLPQPLQRGQITRTVPLLPAMVIGLHEPPPNAALLPSISMDVQAGQAQISASKRPQPLAEVLPRPPEKMFNSPRADAFVPTHSQDGSAGQPRAKEERPNDEAPSPKARKKPRKWKEEETRDLLQGVEKHGFGKWKKILVDPEFTFNDRRSIDLKDRHRVCVLVACKQQKTPLRPRAVELPLLPSSPSTVNKAPFPSKPEDDLQSKPRGLMAENILTTTPPSMVVSKTTRTVDQAKVLLPSKSNPPISEPARTHTAASSAQRTSARRTRRPWSTVEDDSLLEGVAKHGFQWTAIHDDPDLHLSHRKATDLRDRIRNRYPDGYRNAESKPLRAEKLKAKAESKRDGRAETTVLLAKRTEHEVLYPVKKKGARAIWKEKQNGEMVKGDGTDPMQEHWQAGTTLPPLALGDDDWDWGNNTLPPLLDWEDIGI